MNEVIAAAPNGRVLKGHRAISTESIGTDWRMLIRDTDTGRERTKVGGPPRRDRVVEEMRYVHGYSKLRCRFQNLQLG